MSLLKFIKKTQPGATVNEDTVGEVSGYIDTGVYSLNALLSGSIYKGFPANKVVVMAGRSGTGKTFYTLSILKYFLDSNPKGEVIIWDSEGDMRKTEMEKRGLDVTRIGVIPVKTVEQFGTSIKQVLDQYMQKDNCSYPLFFALDSLGQLASEKESEDTREGKNVADMTRAKAIRKVFRVITFQLAEAKVPLLATNHIHSSLNAYGGDAIGGGMGSVYASSQIIVLSKKKEKDADKNTIGGIVTAKTEKSRFTREGQSVQTLLMHKSGLDRYFGLHLIALKHKILKKVSTKIEMPNGESIFGKELFKNPEKYYTKEILDAIDEACQKEFLYGEHDDETVLESVLEQMEAEEEGDDE